MELLLSIYHNPIAVAVLANCLIVLIALSFPVLAWHIQPLKQIRKIRTTIETETIRIEYSGAIPNFAARDLSTSRLMLYWTSRTVEKVIVTHFEQAAELFIAWIAMHMTILIVVTLHAPTGISSHHVAAELATKPEYGIIHFPVGEMVIFLITVFLTRKTGREWKNIREWFLHGSWHD